MRYICLADHPEYGIKRDGIMELHVDLKIEWSCKHNINDECNSSGNCDYRYEDKR